MQVRHTLNVKLVGATGAAVALAAAVALPAVAAGGFKARTTYNCNDAAIAAVTFAMNTPPKTMAAGQTVKVRDSSKVTLDADTTTFFKSVLDWRKFGGTMTSPTAPDSGLKLAIPVTKLDDNGDGTSTALATGNALLRATKTGTYTVRFGDVAATLQGYNTDGTKNGEPLIFDSNSNAPSAAPSCTNTNGTTTPKSAGGRAATVKVVKDRTTTSVSAAFSRAKHQITSAAKVKSHFGLKPTGIVKLSLKKGTHTIKTVKARLNASGVATAVFKNVHSSGKYTVKGVYGGSSRLKSSSGSKGVTVG
jgi:hypothetical protein